MFSQTGEGWENNKLVEICLCLNGYAFKKQRKNKCFELFHGILRMRKFIQTKESERHITVKPVFYPEHFPKGSLFRFFT